MGILCVIWVFALLCAIGGWAEAWVVVILLGIVIYANIKTEIKLQNKDVTNISTAKMAKDYDKSVAVRRRKFANGEYDKD